MQDWTPGQLGFIQVTTGISVHVERLGLYSRWPQRRGLIAVSGSHGEADFKYGTSFLYMRGT